MLSYFTTFLGTNVGLRSWTSALAAPLLGGTGADGWFSLGLEAELDVSFDNVPVGDLKGRQLGIQGHRGAQGVRTEASLYVSMFPVIAKVGWVEKHKG
jgi:hypothetical protein